MKKYQELEMELRLLTVTDVITSSGEDGEPVFAEENEDLWKDFY